MIVQQILNFLDTLSKHENLIRCDSELLDSIKSRFSSKNVYESIKPDDVIFLTECFSKRWYEIIDTTDYTLNPTGINKTWIDFAKELAPETGKAYLYLLIPVVTNTIDFNNLTPLSETVRLENLYLGSTNDTMYRKRGLCDHLIFTGYKLSTCRDIHTRTLSPLSISELSRLKLCRQPDGEFSINGERFSSFWEFLCKKSFVQLQVTGSIQPEILVALRDLILTYRELRSNGANYQSFKKVYLSFLESLNHYELDNINFLYGARLRYNNSEHYLFELLINIYQAREYVLDELMSSVYTWLLQTPCSNEVAPNVHGISQSMMGKMGLRHDKKLYQCLSAVLSLFTTEFTVLPLCGVSINLWDKTNIVFPAAAPIYTQLLPLLEQDMNVNLLITFQKIIDEIIIPTNKGNGLLSWLPSFSSTDSWYRHVQNGTLQERGVYVFEPELIIHTLLKIDPVNHSVHQRLNRCLDELVHTYTQRPNFILQILRVNICFFDFINSLVEEERKKIVSLVLMQDLAEAKFHFISNCRRHISMRLTQIYCDSKGALNKRLSFFAKADIPEFVISSEGIGQVIKVIDAFKVLLHSHKCDLQILGNMKDFLMSLSRPILTVIEREEAARSADQSDYLNAPT